MNIHTLVIDKESDVTISQQIYNFIKTNIDNKNLLPEDKLPTEREFSEIISVSRGTIKNAYKKLELDGRIETIQGSGSYIKDNNENIVSIKNKKGNGIIKDAIRNLKQLNFSDDEIIEVFKREIYKTEKDTLSVCIIYDTQELLLDLKKQLSHIKDIIISVFIIDNILSDKFPEKILENYDLIIIPSEIYKEVAKFLPNRKDSIIKASISLSTKSIIDIATISKDLRIGVICRTNAFLQKVKNALLTFGFEDENILSFFEMDYTTETYFPGGISLLVSFSEAHIFTDEKFKERNDELINKGGKIIKFRYKMEQGTVIYIEDKIKSLIRGK